MDILEKGVGWLSDKLFQNAAQAIEYKRGAVTLPIDAIVGDHAAESDTDVITFESNMLDFLVRPADIASLLAPDGEPDRGDVITWQSRDYEVMGTPNEPEFRRSNRYGNLLRIHTKRISDITIP